MDIMNLINVWFLQNTSFDNLDNNSKFIFNGVIDACKLMSQELSNPIKLDAIVEN